MRINIVRNFFPLDEFKGISLIDACRQCDIVRIKKFLSSQSVNFAHPFTGDTPLHVVSSSVFSKRKQVLEIIIKKGAEMNRQNKDLLTPLHVATKFSHYDVMDFLIKNGADVNSVDGLGQTCLHRAAREDDVAAVRLLLSHAIDPSLVSLQGYTAVQVAKENVLKVLKDPPSDTVDLEMQLLESAKSGDLTAVKKIITSNPRIVNCRDIDGRHSTPLHFASGYNRIPVVDYLLEKGADVHASDKGGLVPLHNASSYGHLEVSQLLIKAGANVNAAGETFESLCIKLKLTTMNSYFLDLWKFSPLHEAAAKGKQEIVKLLLKNGGNPNLKNRDGASPIDLVRDPEVADLLRGNLALLDAAKKGNLARVQRLLTPENINCRDSQGRNSTPLHLAAGYNNFEVAEYLLEQGANVNAQDKGGLIALHNASSYGHLEIAALLIKYDTQVNAVDKWLYTPLHEASQKSRTQLCSLLLAHGADPFMKNQEGQTSLDLSTAEDVKSLLQDAMFARQPLKLPSCTSTSSVSAAVVSSETVILPSGNTIDLQITMPCLSARSCLSPIQGAESNSETLEEDKILQNEYSDVSSFLSKLKLDHLNDLFESEQITLEILAEMGHDDLKQVGVTAYGYRHKILKGITTMRATRGFSFNTNPGTLLIDLLSNDKEYLMVEDEMQSTIRQHQRDNGNMGGFFNRYGIVRIQKIQNRKLWDRYIHRRHEIADDNGGQYNEKMLFHGSPFINAIIQKGFDERHAWQGGMFGAGIYFAENSSKSNQYVYGIGGSGCHVHQDKSCYQCHRSLLLCRVVLGKSFLQFSALKISHSPPGHHSVIGRPSVGGLHFPEYVIYRGEQAYPEYLVTYQIENDKTIEEEDAEHKS